MKFARQALHRFYFICIDISKDHISVIKFSVFSILSTIALAGCMTFSDAAKVIVADNDIVVIIPENKSSVSVSFQRTCVSYFCVQLHDKPFELGYGFSHDVASRIEQLILARGKKKAPKYFVRFDEPYLKITITIFDNTVNYSLVADLRDEFGRSVEKSQCFGANRYPSGSTDVWRKHPDILQNELASLAQQCLGTFRKELGI